MTKEDIYKENSNSDIKLQQKVTNPENIQNQIDEEELKIKQLEQQRLNEEIQHNSKPFWFSKKIVDNPFQILSFCAVIFIICGVIAALAKMIELSKSHDREYLIWENERVQDFDELIEAQTQFQKNLSTEKVPVNTINNQDWITFPILYNKKNENVLTAENIKFLHKIEQKIQNLPDYNKFCLKLASSKDKNECYAGSLISFTQAFGDDINKITQQDVDEKLSLVWTDSSYTLKYKQMFGNDFDEKNKKSKLLRSFFLFGGPLDGHKDLFDDDEKQDEKFDDFTRDMNEKVLEKEDGVPKNVKLLGYSSPMRDIYTLDTANKDFLWAFGSVVFVLLYLGFHLRSLFLSSMSMLSILFSFPITLCIFDGILRITYFSQLHILVVFIVLGISADNIFVFTDCWNQTATYDSIHHDYHQRMAFTLRRASRAMLATSSTTGAAFLATGLSRIMPISSFGFFAGILIPVNFVLVITFYPAVLMVFEKYTKKMCVKKNTKQQEQEKNEDIEKNQQEEQEQKQSESKDQHKVEVFFDIQFNNFVKKYKYIIILVFIIWTSIAVWRGSQLPALSEPEKFLPDSHRYQEARDFMRSDFHASADSASGITVDIYWGVKGINKDGVGSWDPSDLGSIEWDKDFSLETVQNLEYFYEFCETLKNDDMVDDKIMKSFIYDFKDFVGGDFNNLKNDEILPELKEFVKTAKGVKFYNANQIGIIKGELKYISVQTVAKGIPFQPYEKLNPVYEKWENFIKKQNKIAPKGMKGVQQTAQMGWVFMITEKEFTDSAMQGTAISMVFAFVVLVLTTHNIIMALYSIITIGGIVISVISIMEMVGWELGVAESIAIVILIGMSVDYVVHLANHYVESQYPDRHRKMQQSLRDLGISIVSGASTTIGSGIFLFFATLIIFTKFAILIVSTISFSLLYSLLFFSALCHICGPEKEQGNLIYYMKVCKNKLEKKDQSNNDSKNSQEQNQQQQIEVSQKQIQSSSQ